MADLYRKRPVTIEAMRFSGNSIELQDVYAWVESGVGRENLRMDFYTGDLIVRTLEGDMRCAYGDWVIKGIKGEFYPCKNEVFQLTYELVPPEIQDEIPGMIDEMRPMYEKPMSKYEEMVNAIEQIQMRKKHESE